MKFSLSWLRAHWSAARPPADIGRQLTDLGFELEALDDPAPAYAALKDLRIAEIASIAPHPQADTLSLAVLTSGETIVCGAPNLAAGMKAVYAPPGASLPNGISIARRTIRGQISQGMLCSEKELNLGDNDDGLLVLPPASPAGEPASSLASRSDPVFTIAVTPNRPDCLGVRGLARDLAAAGFGKLKPLTKIPPLAKKFASPLKIKNDAPDLCPHFCGLHLRGVKNRPSPGWLQDRLKSAGLRPLHALADITNYFALDRARPLHVYDAEKISGAVIIRRAEKNETFTGLDHKIHQPAIAAETACVIADEKTALGLGGIIGGEQSSCTLATRAVFLESAWFAPSPLARTARALNIDSEARRRFERGVDPLSTLPLLKEAAHWIITLCGGEASAVIEAGQPAFRRQKILFRPASVPRLTGLPAKPARIKSQLTALGCAVSQASSRERAKAKNAFSVTPPSWRPDLTGEADLVEEVMRLEGCSALTPLPLPPARPLQNQAQNRAQNRTQNQMQTLSQLRRFVAGLGFAEVINWSFISAEEAALFGGGHERLKLRNPIAAPLSDMRPSLLPGLLRAAGYNAAYGRRDLRFFEIGPVFDEQGEHTACAGLRAGLPSRHWRAREKKPEKNPEKTPENIHGLFDIKSDLVSALAFLGLPAGRLQAAPAQCRWLDASASAKLVLPQGGAAFFGRIAGEAAALFSSPPAWVFEFRYPAYPLALKAYAAPYADLQPALQPALQPVRRDLAFVLDEAIPAQNVIAAIRQSGGREIVNLTLFDIFTAASLGSGKKSLAFEITLRPAPRTDEEIEKLMQKIAAFVAGKTGGRLRDRPA